MGFAILAPLNTERTVLLDLTFHLHSPSFLMLPQSYLHARPPAVSIGIVRVIRDAGISYGSKRLFLSTFTGLHEVHIFLESYLFAI